MNAPNFNVSQKHAGLVKHFGSQDEESRICVPSALATALIHLKATEPKAKTLNLLGFDEEKKEVDANKVVHQLVECTRANQNLGTYPHDAARCLAWIAQTDHLDLDVKLIYPGANVKDPIFTYEKRVPKIEEIRSFIRAGYSVLASVYFYNVENGVWKTKYSHMVGINGYARQKNWPDDLLWVFLSDPAFLYERPTKYPLYEQALLTRVRDTRKIPYGMQISLEGSTHWGLSSRALIGGILVFRIR